MENENEVEETDLEAEANGSEEEIETKANPGIEKRIAELTKQRHDSEREAQTLRDLNMQLLARATAPAAAPVEDKWKDVDPAIREMFREGITQVQQAAEGKMRAQALHFESLMESQEVTTAAERFGLNEEYTKEAATIIREAKRRGIPVNKEEVLDMVIGKAVREGKYTPNNGVNTRRAAPLTGVRSPNFAAPEAQNQKPLPNNYDDLDPEEQLAILNKRGVGNSKL